MLGESKGAAHQGAGGADILDFPGDSVEVGLAVMLVEHRLGIKQVHLTGAAVHEEVNDGLGFRRKMRRTRFEIRDRAIRLCGGYTEPIAAKQIRQGGTVNPTGDAREKAAASKKIVERTLFLLRVKHEPPQSM